MKIKILKFLLLCSFLIEAQMLFAQDSARYFTIRVIDSQTGRGVPLVEFQTSNHLRYYTDSKGIIAFHEPALMNQMVSFKVFSHGYDCPKDRLILNTLPGSTKVVKIKRLNIAERLYRITGQDIYGQSARLGLPGPIKNQALNGKVMGQDTFIETLYKGKLYWFWGDTDGPAGFNGEASGAISELPGKGGLDPDTGIDLTYFVDDNGFTKHMCPFDENTLVWIQWLAALTDEKKNERLYALYTEINQDGTQGENGLAVFNDSSENFEKIKIFDEWYGKNHRSGHPFIVKTKGQEYIYIINFAGIERVPADIRHLADPSSYEHFECFAPNLVHDSTAPLLERDAANRLVYGWKSNTGQFNRERQKDLIKSGKMSTEEGLWQFRDIRTGNAIPVDPASVFWNSYRNRWVMIAYEFAGGVWFFEGDTPTGPWVYGRKIVSHENYDFYNVAQHPFFDKENGRLIYFEGTYTTGFSGNANPTPLYDYNQMMYRLAMDDKRLSLPAPVYLVLDERNKEQYLLREGIDSLQLWKNIKSIPFFAIPVSARNAINKEFVPVYSNVSARSPILTTKCPSSREVKPLFYSLPVVPIPHYKHDPISGTWKCKALMHDTTYAEFDLTLEKDGEVITGSYDVEGYFRNDSLAFTFRIVDYAGSGRLQNGKLSGVYRKEDGTEKGNWSGIRTQIPKEDTVSSSVVYLYEYQKVGSEECIYSVDPNLSSASLTRAAQPVCRVWLNPSSVIALDYKAKPGRMEK